LAERRGDSSEAATDRTWFQIIYGNTVWELDEARTARTGHPGDSIGSNAPFYGHYTYRRPTPWNLIAGDLLRIVTP
jgi:hypothetical protein